MKVFALVLLVLALIVLPFAGIGTLPVDSPLWWLSVLVILALHGVFYYRLFLMPFPDPHLQSSWWIKRQEKRRRERGSLDELRPS